MAYVFDARLPVRPARDVVRLFLSRFPQGVLVTTTDTMNKPKVATMIPPVPTYNPAWIPATFLDPQGKNSMMLADAIASDKVDVDQAITDNGSTTNVFCEGKKIALKGNNNVCMNDSVTRDKCLKIK